MSHAVTTPHPASALFQQNNRRVLTTYWPKEACLVNWMADADFLAIADTITNATGGADRHPAVL